MRRLVSRTGIVLTVALAAAAAEAAVCSVPSPSHPTLGAAVRDAGCTLVQAAAGAFPENVAIARDLALQGAGSGASVVQGFFVASGAGVEVTLAEILVDGTAAGVAGCWGEILLASDGATLDSGADLRVVNTAAGGAVCRLFADGFESGGVLAWSASVP